MSINGLRNYQPRIVALDTKRPLEVKKLAKVAAEHLLKGEIIATPTDTIYGLAGLANNIKAVRRIYDIKCRDSSKPVAICVAEIEDVYKWGQVTIEEELLDQLLPGPVTLCFNRLPSLNSELNPDSDLVGIRIPNHPFIRQVCRETGLPLALTSANLSGAKSALEIEDFSELYHRLSCIFDAGALGLTEKSRAGSTIVDLSKCGTYSIIRQGSAETETVAKLENFGLKRV